MADIQQPEPPPLSRAFERHIQTVLAAILIGLVAWVGITVTQNREHISRIDERLIFMREDLEEIKEELKERRSNVAEVPHLQDQLRRLRSHVGGLEDANRSLGSRVTRLEERLDARGKE